MRTDIPKLLSAFDIFVLVSYTEGLSTAMLEAMSSARAIVCSDIPANRELISNELDGLLVNPDDTEGIKESIQRLCKDDSLRRVLGDNAKSKASKYDKKKVFPQILNEYNSIVEINR